MRWLVALPLFAAAAVGATACGFQMLLCLAYGVWGAAFLYGMGIAAATCVGLLGWAVLRFR